MNEIMLPNKKNIIPQNNWTTIICLKLHHGFIVNSEVEILNPSSPKEVLNGNHKAYLWNHYKVQVSWILKKIKVGGKSWQKPANS